ncbi:MAG: HD domain-containing protein [Chloroflexi bacterium]|nr:HD domain-containing protein [Chloroflexota bacterium]
MPRVTISELQSDMSLRKELYLLRTKSLATTRTGSMMLRVTLADKSGTIQGVMFDAQGWVADNLSVGKGVEVTGRITSYKDQLQVTLERIAPANLPSIEDYLPGPSRPMQDMLAELEDLRGSIRQPDLARLLEAILSDPATYRAYTQAPAAKAFHHACVGGLLEHSLAVARLAQCACGLYAELDRDLVITLALLHDLGKIRAYDAISFEQTPEGNLWSHLYIGAAEVDKVIDRLEGFDPDLRLRIVHGLLAHHGKRENGSPVVPATLEAVVVSHADNLDASAKGVIDFCESHEVDAEGFTDNSLMHESRLYSKPTRT